MKQRAKNQRNYARRSSSQADCRGLQGQKEHDEQSPQRQEWGERPPKSKLKGDTEVFGWYIVVEGGSSERLRLSKGKLGDDHCIKLQVGRLKEWGGERR